MPRPAEPRVHVLRPAVAVPQTPGDAVRGVTPFLLIDAAALLPILCPGIVLVLPALMR